jgi:hypothetical protein
VVTPFSESRESKKVVSVTELLDQFKAETEPDAPQQPKWETVNGTGDSVLDKFSNVDGATFLCRSAGPKRKSRTPTPSKRGNSRRYRSNIRESPESRARHNRCLVNRRRPTMRARPETQQAKVYAHLHYGSDLSAASKALVHGDAVGLPTLVIGACKTPRDPLEGLYNGQHGEPRTEPPDDGNAARDARKYAAKNGHVITVPGRARAVIHKLPPESVPARHSAPVGVAHHAGESGEECASAPIEGARTLTTAAPVSETETAPAHLADLLGVKTIEEAET